MYFSVEIPQIGAAVVSEPRPRVPIPSPLAICVTHRSAHPFDRGGQGRVDARAVMRITARFDKGPHRVGQFRLAQQYPMHPAAENLAELPGVEAHIVGVGAIDRRLDNNRGRAMAGSRRTALDQPRHVFAEPGHVEGAVLHPDIDVVGPSMGVFTPLRAGQHMAAMAADIIDRLILSEQFDRTVDALGHRVPPRLQIWRCR